MQGPPRLGEFQQDLHKIFSEGPVQDPARNPHRIASESSQLLQDIGQNPHILRTSKTAP